MRHQYGAETLRRVSDSVLPVIRLGKFHKIFVYSIPQSLRDCLVFSSLLQHSFSALNNRSLFPLRNDSCLIISRESLICLPARPLIYFSYRNTFSCSLLDTYIPLICFFPLSPQKRVPLMANYDRATSTDLAHEPPAGQRLDRRIYEQHYSDSRQEWSYLKGNTDDQRKKAWKRSSERFAYLACSST